jgi:O-antigen/teichoic acid export membrane protein
LAAVSLKPIDSTSVSSSRLRVNSVALGTVWGLAGQVVTLGASFIAAPFVIRALGPEAYGLLLLSNVLIGYLAVADLGMGVASTKFAAAAHTRGDDEEEADVIRMALLIAVLPGLLIAVGLFAGAEPLVDRALRIPPHLRAAALAAVRLTALGFLARTVAGVLNTPQLVRMRLDLCTLINSGTGLLQIIAVPLVLAAGGGLQGAVTVVVVMAVVNAVLHGLIACRLAPALRRPRLRLGLLRPLMRYGLALVVSALVGLALADAEKLLLPRFASVAALGYYGVAYTLARLLTVGSGALSQALLPAFSRLAGPADQSVLADLYTDSFRVVWLVGIPVTVLFWVGGGTFLRVWSGPDYARHATAPLCILVAGVACNALAMIPYNLLCAVGKAGLIARYNFIEVVPYLLTTALLTSRFGASGTAAAWSLRVSLSLVFYVWAARRVVGLPTRALGNLRGAYVTGGASLFLPALALVACSRQAEAIAAAAFALLGYVGLLWTHVLDDRERGAVLQLFLPIGAFGRRIMSKTL